MKSFKTVFKYLGRILLGFLGLIAIYFVAVLVLSNISKKPKETIVCEELESVYLVSNGIHLDLVFKKEQLDEEILKRLQVSNRAKYVAFGWGDKDFYLNTPTWNDLTVRTLLKALFWKSESAMHVTDYRMKSSQFVTVELCSVQVEILKQYIESSFATKAGKVTEIGKGYGKQDRFYEANGSYNAIKTCNEWVNIGLKKAYIKTAVWSPFDDAILDYFDGEL